MYSVASQWQIKGGGGGEGREGVRWVCKNPPHYQSASATPTFGESPFPCTSYAHFVSTWGVNGHSLVGGREIMFLVSYTL